MQHPKSASGQDKLAVSVGFALIALVGIITVLRSVDFKTKSKPSAATSQQTAATPLATISTQDLQAKINKQEPLLILDVRSAEAFIEEHALDAVNAPLDGLESNTSFDLSRPIYLLAASSEDQAADKAAKILNAKGTRSVTILAGGMESWKNLGGQTVTSGDPNSFVNQAKVRFVQTTELKDNLDSGKIFLIDARPKADFDQGHIRTAVSIPFEEIERRRSELPYGKTIVVYDANEVLGFQTAVRVYDLTAMPAYELKGGFEAWKNQKLEIVK